MRSLRMTHDVRHSSGCFLVFLMHVIAVSVASLWQRNAAHEAVWPSKGIFDAGT
jgi:hypothetical protein